MIAYPDIPSHQTMMTYVSRTRVAVRGTEAHTFRYLDGDWIVEDMGQLGSALVTFSETQATRGDGTFDMIEGLGASYKSPNEEGFLSMRALIKFRNGDPLDVLTARVEVSQYRRQGRFREHLASTDPTHAREAIAWVAGEVTRQHRESSARKL